MKKPIIKVQEQSSYTTIKIALPSGELMQVNVFEDSVNVGTPDADKMLSISMNRPQTIIIKPIDK